MTKSYLDIHNQAILVDTHNDILTQAMERGHLFDQDLRGKTHSDLRRWKVGGVDAQFFAIWCDENKKQPFDYANQQIDLFNAVLSRNPEEILLAKSSADINKAKKDNKLAALLGLEGGHMIEDDLSKLDHFYKRGVKYMTLTWNNSNNWATSASDELKKKKLPFKGLTDFGREVIKRMNRLGMLVDVSHAGESTFLDVMKTSTKPVVATHSNSYTLCPHERNLKDEQIKAIAGSGGVIHVNFFSGFLDPDYYTNKASFIKRHQKEYNDLLAKGMIYYLADEYLFNQYKEEVDVFRAPFKMLINHIEYIIDLVGIDHIGLGSDFDGIESTPKLLDDVTSYPLLTKALFEKGYSEDDLSKVLGGNFLRVMLEVS